jgi:group I intron endonuclease
MKSGIYKITNPEGKTYIGCSKDIDNRIKQYKNINCPNQSLLLESLIYYGWKNHQVEIIEYTADLIEREKYWINHFQSHKLGLNNNTGGGGTQNHTEETKLKISSSSKLNKGKRIKSHWKGKSYTNEHKEKISLSKKEKPSHWKGKKRPSSFGENLRKKRKGVPLLKNRKPILQYDKEGNFIKEHNSIETAALYVNGNPSAINNALKKGGNATSSSYIWRYKDTI